MEPVRHGTYDEGYDPYVWRHALTILKVCFEHVDIGQCSFCAPAPVTATGAYGTRARHRSRRTCATASYAREKLRERHQNEIILRASPVEGVDSCNTINGFYQNKRRKTKAGGPSF